MARGVRHDSMAADNFAHSAPCTAHDMCSVPLTSHNTILRLHRAGCRVAWLRRDVKRLGLPSRYWVRPKRTDPPHAPRGHATHH
eukprot:71140-Prymnesium_polylepis.1